MTRKQQKVIEHLLEDNRFLRFSPPQCAFHVPSTTRLELIRYRFS